MSVASVPSNISVAIDSTHKRVWGALRSTHRSFSSRLNFMLSTLTIVFTMFSSWDGVVMSGRIGQMGCLVSETSRSVLWTHSPQGSHTPHPHRCSVLSVFMSRSANPAKSLGKYVKSIHIQTSRPKLARQSNLLFNSQ